MARSTLPKTDVSVTEAEPPGQDTSRFEPKNRQRLSGPAIRTFTAVMDLWELTENQRLLVLGGPLSDTYHAWTKAAWEHEDFMLPVDILVRISAVLGIHKALAILYPAEAGAAWLMRPHASPTFGGHPPMDYLLSGTLDGLLAVRGHLDATCGGTAAAPNEIDLDYRPYADGDVTMS